MQAGWYVYAGVMSVIALAAVLSLRKRKVK
ncbi:MAG TPA: LPXTG cell wall anchor domain-containing protein [Candidatus Mediterraneibacter excrementipullorum]|nr:LPXTG cell wall anchor domain-containing protein [Candidatus Mediterraneibacter excrementipullorum]